MSEERHILCRQLMGDHRFTSMLAEIRSEAVEALIREDDPAKREQLTQLVRAHDKIRGRIEADATKLNQRPQQRRV